MDADGRLLCAHNLSRSALDQIYGTSKEDGMSTYVWRPFPSSLRFISQLRVVLSSFLASADERSHLRRY